MTSPNISSPQKTHPLILCVFGVHDWKRKESHNAGGIAELGGYIFLPNTATVFECSCRATKTVITNYRGEVIAQRRGRS